MRALILALVAIAASGAAAPAQSVYDPGGYPYPSDRPTLTQRLLMEPYREPEPVAPPSAYHAPETWIGSHTPAMDIWNDNRGNTIVCHKTPYTTICQ